MDATPSLPQLQRSLDRLRWMVVGLAVLVAALAAATSWLALQRHAPMHVDALTTHRLQVLDDRGVVRVEITQDGAADGRRSRAAGLTVFDRTGAERGGFTTYDDGGVGIALDAPLGKGEDHLRDRLGLTVNAEGSSQLLLSDNLTRGVVRLRAEGDGGGGLDTFEWDMQGNVLQTRTITFDGDQRTRQPIGEPQ